MNACRILPDAGATGKSACSSQRPPRGANPGHGSTAADRQCGPAPPAPQLRRWRAFRGTV